MYKYRKDRAKYSEEHRIINIVQTIAGTLTKQITKYPKISTTKLQV